MEKKEPIKVDWDKHLFRSSSFGMLMSGIKEISQAQLNKIDELEAKALVVKGLNKGDAKKLAKLESLSIIAPLNEDQQKEYNDLKTKEIAPAGLTVKQQETLDNLISVRDSPIELSKGAKTYLRKLRREIKFNRRKVLKSKFLTKGLELEEDAITFLSLYHGEFFENNKGRLNDDYFTGEADITQGYDTKVSWELDSLPDPEEPLPNVYEFQNRVYMRLYNKEKWTTSAILLDITPHALQDKIYREGFEAKWAGKTLPTWRKLEIISFYTYTEEKFFEYMELFDCKPELDDEKSANVILDFVELPINERIVEKVTLRDLDIERDMKTVVKLSREYLKLQDELMNE